MMHRHIYMFSMPLRTLLIIATLPSKPMLLITALIQFVRDTNLMVSQWSLDHVLAMLN